MLFVWSKSRVVPVRVTDFSVTEEAFDPALNPIRAKVSLGLRVLHATTSASRTAAARSSSATCARARRWPRRPARASLASLGLTNLP